MKNYNISINASEATIEDILCDNMEKFLGLKFIQRQVVTPAGIIDVIAKSPDNDGVYFVIELKKENIDDHTYVQAHRYCKYMNSMYNKNYNRVFIPLLIGKNLRHTLVKTVALFRKSDGYIKDDITNTYYTCFGFNLDEGLSFDFHDMAQFDYESEYGDGWTYVHNMSEELDVIKHFERGVKK